MRSGLKDGKLVPPRSLRVAQARYNRLLGKIDDVESQLAITTGHTHPAWRRDSAERALAAFQSERRQLRAWIADALLRRCRDALRSFRDDGAEMSAGELELLERLDEYLSKETADASR